MHLIILCLISLGAFVHASENIALQRFAAGNLNFTADIYEELTESNADNLIVSPISAEIILALTSEGAYGTTAHQLTNALHLLCRRDTEAAVEQLNLNIFTDDLKLLSANRIFIGDKFKLVPKFEKIATQVYKSGVENVNFGDSSQTTNLINQWVAENTNNKIQNLITPNMITSNTRIVLVNALYFSGLWNMQFKTKNTRNATFHLSSESTKEVEMMHSGDFDVYEYSYSKSLKAKFLGMSYKNSNVTMTFVLPDAVDGIAQIEGNVEKYLKPHKMSVERVAVALPKFTTTSTINFKQVLQQLGVTQIFENSANLTGISKEPGLHVDYVVQKAFIAVTESGTEAAAATAVIGGLTAVLKPPSRPTLSFNADHPFLYYIRDNRSGVILFAGRFTN